MPDKFRGRDEARGRETVGLLRHIHGIQPGESEGLCRRQGASSFPVPPRSQVCGQDLSSQGRSAAQGTRTLPSLCSLLSSLCPWRSQAALASCLHRRPLPLQRASGQKLETRPARTGAAMPPLLSPAASVS